MRTSELALEKYKRCATISLIFSYYTRALHQAKYN